MYVYNYTRRRALKGSIFRVLSFAVFKRHLKSYTCLMRFETEALGDSCFYGRHINPFYACMYVYNYTRRRALKGSIFRVLNISYKCLQLCKAMRTFPVSLKDCKRQVRFSDVLLCASWEKGMNYLILFTRNFGWFDMFAWRRELHWNVRRYRCTNLRRNVCWKFQLIFPRRKSFVEFSWCE